MKKYVDGQYVEIPEAEVIASKKQSTILQAQEATRPLTAEEVSRMLIAAQINTLTVDDSTALRMRDFYPTWAAGTVYTAAAGRGVGYKVGRNGTLHQALH